MKANQSPFLEVLASPEPGGLAQRATPGGKSRSCRPGAPAVQGSSPGGGTGAGEKLWEKVPPTRERRRLAISEARIAICALPASDSLPSPSTGSGGTPTADSALIHPPGRPPLASAPIFPHTVCVDKVGFLGDSAGDRPPCKDSHVVPCRPLPPPPPPPAHTAVPGPLPHCPQTLLFAQSTKASLSHPRGPPKVLQTGT